MKLLLVIFVTLSMSAIGQVSPLLSTTWNQTCYYNELMPTVGSGGSCGKAYTGCNATAMAQICKYYNYPVSGFGSHCNTNSPSDCVDYGLASYNYAAMPNNVTSSNAQVATLMYDLGVAVDMNWNGTNSTSFFSSSVLKEHYAYSPKMYSTATFLFGSTAELIAAIKLELDAGRPVFCKGGGHFYLIDGYNASDNFHMNFGWSGVYDGYYPIDNVVNGGGTFTPSNFIFQIEPLQGELQTAVDTIFIGAAGVSNESIEFTSLLNWTMSTGDTWITLNTNSGSAGYFNFNSGSTFASPVNNGPERTGYILVQNANDTDTVVVVQASSSLQTTPNPLSFVETGGTETVMVSYLSWGTWTATTSDTWLSVSPGSGTGNGSFDVIANDNTGGLARTAYAIVTAGVFTDSILVSQDGSSLGLTEQSPTDIKLQPNPSNGGFVLTCSSYESIRIEVFDIHGQLVVKNPNYVSGNPLRLETEGLYMVKWELPNGNSGMKKLIVK